jgi:phosphoserine phosphatase RsbU/P
VEIMTTASKQEAARLLVATSPDGKVQKIHLDKDRYSLGRSTNNELCYAEDNGLSRQHILLERDGEEWTIRDLGSKNGTYVNGMLLSGVRQLRPGDRISASRVELIYQAEGSSAATDHTVIFDASEGRDTIVAEVSTTLEYLLSQQAAEAEEPGSSPAQVSDKWLNPVQVLVRVNAELSVKRPISEMFDVILHSAIQAVRAERGVLMTLDGDNLTVRASRGAGFRVSTTVCDKVIKERASLLIRDAQADAALRERQSIVLQQVRTLMAVPLQTEDQVIGLIYVDTLHFFRQFSSEDLNLLTLLANVAAVRIERERLTELEQASRLMESELQAAAEIQRIHLPAEAPQVPGFDVAGHNAPCRTVGGDYYDFLPYNDGRLGLVVADVAGKGMPASLLMMSLQARVQVVADSPEDMGSLVARLNRNLARTFPRNRFITAFFAIADPHTGELAYCNAGHNHPIVVRASGQVETLGEGGPPMGILPDYPYETAAAMLNPGDMLVLYSDGVTEACNQADQEFGEERLGEIAAGLRNVPAAGIIDHVLKEVRRWSHDAPPADDITLVVLRRLA